MFVKKRWKVLVGLFAVWIMTTAYFYVQHVVTVKMASISGWQLSNENPVQFKEIRLVNKGPRDAELNGYILRVARIINYLPGETLKNLLLQPVLYYRSPYQRYTDGWELTVSGVYFKGESNFDFENLNILSNDQIIKIFADGEQVFPHMSQRESHGNLIYFTVGVPGVNPNVRSLKIEMNIGGKIVSGSFSPKFTTKSYGFFTRVPGYYDNISPEKTVMNEFWKIQQGKSVDSAVFQSPDLNNRLLWASGRKDLAINPEAGYLESYKNYQNVFTVSLKFALDKPTYSKYSSEQVFYLVMANDKWVIVDITPFKEI